MRERQLKLLPTTVEPGQLARSPVAGVCACQNSIVGWLLHPRHAIPLLEVRGPPVEIIPEPIAQRDAVRGAALERDGASSPVDHMALERRQHRLHESAAVPHDL